MHPLITWAKNQEPEIVRFIQELVECESPSDSAADVGRCVDLLVQRTSDIAEASTFHAPGVARHLLLEFQVGAKQGRVLALGHSDTVWPVGTLAHMPFRQAEGRLWGPGVFDMKAGLAFFIYAVRGMMQLGIPFQRRVSLLVVSDEEVGSPTSRALTEEQARASDYVLVLEPGTGSTGKLKTSRKGVGRYRIHVTGRAAHAGVDFENGASAIVEAAKQVERCAALTDLKAGVTLNPGVIRGGTRSNVIAAEAEIDVDLRVVRMADAERLDRELRALRPFDPRCSLSVEGGLNRPPMERSGAIAALFERARAIGAEMGITVEESATGGGSDGNFTAALGVPTLDGLGAVGEGAHALNESILVDRIADRVALLGRLLL